MRKLELLKIRYFGSANDVMIPKNLLEYGMQQFRSQT